MESYQIGGKLLLKVEKGLIEKVQELVDLSDYYVESSYLRLKYSRRQKHLLVSFDFCPLEVSHGEIGEIDSAIEALGPHLVVKGDWCEFNYSGEDTSELLIGDQDIARERLLEAEAIEHVSRVESPRTLRRLHRMIERKLGVKPPSAFQCFHCGSSSLSTTFMGAGGTEYGIAEDYEARCNDCGKHTFLELRTERCVDDA